MIFKFNEDKSDQPKVHTTAIPAPKPFDMDFIHREPVTHGQPLNQADDEDDTFSKGYN